jgi:murein DD-endopeptidase MepM/ murein hydrolase activator NlpD
LQNLKKIQSLQDSKFVKKLIYILSISCIGILQLQASPFALIDEKKPGDDKKSKLKREDTTKLVLHEELEESSDSTQLMFPSNELYASWNTNSAHPYNFYQSFKSDSVELTLVNEGECEFSMPFRGSITSEFGWRRYRPHYGTDIDLETGDEVVSCFDGMVRLAKYCHGYGNCIIIRHANGLETVYGHLSKIMVEPGQTLFAGSLIGLGGNTGRSRGSHLHFEMRYLGQALNSEDFIDYSTGDLKSNCFMLRKSDVKNKYDLRAIYGKNKRGKGHYGSGKSAVAGKNGIYKIRPGDTLSSIAARHGTSVKALCQKNGLKPTSVLRLGQKLRT